MSDAMYVYAIVRRETSLRTTDGDFSRLTLVPWRELAAVTGRATHDEARLTTEAALQHETVVEALRRHCPALPVRFGTVFRDETAVAAALSERYEQLATDLDRLGDKVELSLTALWRAPVPDDPGGSADRANDLATGGSRGGGARYLLGRAAEFRREASRRESARDLAEALDREVGSFALDRRVSLVPTERIAVRAAYLLKPMRVGDFERAFAAMRRSRGDVRALLTGPWPPYSFVTLAGTPGSSAPEGRLAAIAQLLTDSMWGRRG